MRRRLDPIPLLAGGLLLVFAGLGLDGALRWIGAPFPGFLVLENRVVPSVGLSLWPATADGALFQSEVVAVAGREIHEVGEIQRVVASVPVGTELAWTFRSDRGDFVRRIETRRFELRDFVLLFGLFVLNGLALAGAALAALSVRGRNRSALSAVPILMIGALWVLTALDLYGPYRLFRLHALFEALLFPACFHMALGFPRPAGILQRHPWLPWPAYVLAAGLAVAYQLGLGARAAYSASHLLATSALGAALVVLMVAEVERYRSSTSLVVREHIRVLAVGAVLALSLPICLTVAELLTGGRAPQNAMALTTFLFPLAVAYTVVTDAGLRRRVSAG